MQNIVPFPRQLIGMLTPSSNTVLEPYTSLMLEPLFPRVSAHFGRFRVTRIALDDDASDQFRQEPILAAAELLADARTDVIAWNGTSASWLGFDTDERLCAGISARTGVKATSSILSLNRLIAERGVKRLALVTPYTEDVGERIVANYASIGVEVVAGAHCGMSDNFSFAEITEERIGEMCAEVAGAAPDAIAIVCTNMRGALVGRRGGTPAKYPGLRFRQHHAVGLPAGARRADDPARPLRLDVRRASRSRSGASGGVNPMAALAQERRRRRPARCTSRSWPSCAACCSMANSATARASRRRSSACASASPARRCARRSRCSPPRASSSCGPIAAPSSRPIDPVEVAHVFELKGAIEHTIGRLAAVRATPEDRARIEQAHAELGAHPDPAAYTALNQEFHRALAAATHNPVLLQTYDNLQKRVLRLRFVVNENPTRVAQSFVEHENIMVAFRAGARLDLAERLEEHNRLTGEAVMRRLKREGA